METQTMMSNGMANPYNAYNSKPRYQNDSWLSTFLLMAAKYAQSSTMHGIGHVLGGRPRQKLYWGVLVTLGMCMAIIHLRFHVKNYLESPVSTEIQHEVRDFTFPDVTFCSQTPTTSRMYSRVSVPNRYGNTKEDYITLGGFYSGAELLHYKTNYTVDTQIHRDMIYRQRSSYTSHKRSFYPSEEMIFSCSYRGKDCMHHFHLVNDPFYWNCYTFVPKERISTSTNPEDGLVVTIYTATEDIKEFVDKLHLFKIEGTFFNRTNITEFLSSHETGFSFYSRILQNSYEPAGMKIVIHDKNTYPFAKDHGFVLTNGEYAKIGLEMYVEDRLDRPNVPCNESNPEMLIRQAVNDDGTESITKHVLQEQDCELSHRQQFIVEKCGCRSHFYPYRMDISGPPLCYNYTEYVSELIRETNTTLKEWNPGSDSKSMSQYYLKLGHRLVHKTKVGQAVFQRFKKRVDCHDKAFKTEKIPKETEPCLLGCGSSVYKYYLSSVPWPRDYDLFRLLDQTILPAVMHTNGTFKPIAEELLIFNDLKTKDTWNSTIRIIERNFLRVVLHPMKLKSNVHLEKYSYTVLEVLSEVGGILGLYLGMSILTLFEFIDMLFEVCACLRYSNQNKRRHRAAARTCGGGIGMAGGGVGGPPVNSPLMPVSKVNNFRGCSTESSAKTAEVEPKVFNYLTQV